MHARHLDMFFIVCGESGGVRFAQASSPKTELANIVIIKGHPEAGRVGLSHQQTASSTETSRRLTSIFRILCAF